MSENPNPAVTLPRRCPVCGSWEVRPHRIERLQHDAAPEPDSDRFACSAGHVFLAADPLLTRSHELVSRTHQMIAHSRRLVSEVYKLLDEFRRTRTNIRH